MTKLRTLREMIMLKKSRLSKISPTPISFSSIEHTFTDSDFWLFMDFIGLEENLYDLQRKTLDNLKQEPNSEQIELLLNECEVLKNFINKDNLEFDMLRVKMINQKLLSLLSSTDRLYIDSLYNKLKNDVESGKINEIERHQRFQKCQIRKMNKIYNMLYCENCGDNDYLNLINLSGHFVCCDCVKN